ncbi:hypothetical protein AB0I81_23885 [Nonomuraea sp. NPDC050404]|uniref:hypothetical protein n=1 Tax=Nonomuraea sp. NPDC050404 TaxID=3155783 RepID=UPI0033ED47DA
MARHAIALAGAAAALTLLGTTLPAQAATGQVVVFSTEFEPLTTYDNPTGCTKLPISAHVVNNQTDSKIQTYSDPLCMFPALTIPPNHGAHIMPGTASFSA